MSILLDVILIAAVVIAFAAVARYMHKQYQTRGLCGLCPDSQNGTCQHAGRPLKEELAALTPEQKKALKAYKKRYNIK